MNLTGRATAILQHWALMTGLGIAVLGIAVAGFGFLAAGYFVFLTRHFDNAAAAAIVGGTLLAVAILVAIIGKSAVRKMKKPQPSLLSDFGGTLGLGARLVGIMVRRDPKKAIIIAAVSGALAEFIMSDSKK